MSEGSCAAAVVRETAPLLGVWVHSSRLLPPSCSLGQQHRSPGGIALSMLCRRVLLVVPTAVAGAGAGVLYRDWPGPKAWPGGMGLVSFFAVTVFLQALVADISTKV